MPSKYAALGACVVWAIGVIGALGIVVHLINRIFI